jgi:hypothetical protein
MTHEFMMRAPRQLAILGEISFERNWNVRSGPQADVGLIEIRSEPQ